MRAPFAETAIFFRPAPKSSGGVAGLPHLDQTSPPRHTTDPNQRPPRNLGNHHGGTDCNDSPQVGAIPVFDRLREQRVVVACCAHVNLRRGASIESKKNMLRVWHGID
jgi:hypothetical protein